MYFTVEHFGSYGRLLQSSFTHTSINRVVKRISKVKLQ